MATHLIFHQNVKGGSASSTTYATAYDTAPTLSGTGPWNVQQNCGQTFVTPNYTCFQCHFQYDLRNINGATAISFATGCTSDNSTTDFTIEARLNSSYISRKGSEFSGLTRVASLSTAGILTDNINSMTADSGALANILASVDSSGFIALLCCSANQTNQVAPTTGERVALSALVHSGGPRITLTDESVLNSSSFTSSGTFTPTVTTNFDVECVGGGGKPAASASQEAGAGGGAWSYRANMSLVAGTGYTVTVGTGATVDNTSGNDSTFNNGSGNACLAAGGTSTTGGEVTNAIGHLCFRGGDGAAAQGGGGHRGGSGGGGAATSGGPGNAGSAGSGTGGGAGGNDGDNAATNKGGDGGTYSAGGNNGSGAGGGAGGGSSAGNSGNGADGKVTVYWYESPSILREIMTPEFEIRPDPLVIGY